MAQAKAWVVASIAGILALIAIETGISYLRGGVDLRAPWMPLWGALVMGLISVYFSRRPQVTPRVGLVLASLVTASFLVAMGLNGAIAVFGLAMILTFVHIVAPPNVALGASLLVLAASVLTVTQQTAVSPAVSARVLAAACIALLVVQFLARQNRRLSEVAQSVTFRLRTMLEGMGEELRQTRQERDIAAATDACIKRAQRLRQVLDGGKVGLRKHDSVHIIVLSRQVYPKQPSGDGPLVTTPGADHPRLPACHPMRRR